MPQSSPVFRRLQAASDPSGRHPRGLLRTVGVTALVLQACATGGDLPPPSTGAAEAALDTPDPEPCATPERVSVGSRGLAPFGA